MSPAGGDDGRGVVVWQCRGVGCCALLGCLAGGWLVAGVLRMWNDDTVRGRRLLAAETLLLVVDADRGLVTYLWIDPSRPFVGHGSPLSESVAVTWWHDARTEQ